jgi:hypothetical protein
MHNALAEGIGASISFRGTLMPIASGKRLSRRDFLKFSGINLVALAMSKPDPELLMLPEWPAWRLDQFPPMVQAIFQCMPDLEVALDGTLRVKDAAGGFSIPVPQATTQWNRENSLRSDRLIGQVPWGIVLHWYGDRDTFDRSVKGYLRGFDSLREVDGELLRTSAHFLVGDARVTLQEEKSEGLISILQT